MTREFRYDINGLRAVAVIAVVLYHFKVGFFEGGFVGVDVFFVISGFLMTGIITRKIEKSDFNLLSFYADRCNRIVPALLVLCFALFAFGVLALFPSALISLSKSTIASLTFTSNIFYWSNSGYFDPESAHNWLLHTWSLSVEWQFYILYPILVWLIFLNKFIRRHAFAVLTTLTVISFALCQFMVNIQPSAAFYLLPPRAWELLLGGLVALYRGPRPTHRVAVILPYAGLAMIGVAIFSFDAFTPWPSAATLLPTLGTAAVIFASRADAIWANNPPMRKIGLWSYSLYLWHWPLAVAAHYYGYDFTPAVVLVCILLTTGLALVSFTFVEEPSRRRLSAPRAWTLHGAGRTLTICLVAATGLAAIAVAQDGLPWRRGGTAEARNVYAQAADDRVWPAGCGGISSRGHIRTCATGPAKDAKIAIVGDSHAQQWWPRVANNKQNALFVTLNGCPFLPDIDLALPGSRCSIFQREAMTQLSTGHFDKVIVIVNWSGYGPMGAGRPGAVSLCKRTAQGCEYLGDDTRSRQLLSSSFDSLGAQLAALKKAGADVYLVQSQPTPGFPVAPDFERRWFEGRDVNDLATFKRADFVRFDELARSNLARTSALSGAELIDPVPHECPDADCRTADPRGVPIFRDANHVAAAAILDDRYSYLDDEFKSSRP